MNIDKTTALNLLSKIKEIFDKHKDKQDTLYWYSRCVYSNEIVFSYTEKKQREERKRITIDLRKTEIVFDLKNECFYYKLDYKQKNWFEKLFFDDEIDYSDQVYQEAKTFSDYITSLIAEKDKNRHQKCLDEFLK